MTRIPLQEHSYDERASLSANSLTTTAEPRPPDYEKGLTLAALNMYDAAIEEFRSVTRGEPGHRGAWQKLAQLLRWAGKDMEADRAGATAERCAGHGPEWQSARDARTPAQLEAAERVLEERSDGRNRAGQLEALRSCLLENPTDAAAMHVLSRVVLLNGDNMTSLGLLERTLELSPLHDIARAELVTMLMRDSHFARALEHTTILLQQKPLEADYYALHCDALSGSGNFAAALAITEELLRQCPNQVRFWFDYAHLLLGAGRRDEAAQAFRKCLEIIPRMGRAYWGLAALKSGFLTEDDVAAIRGSLGDPGLSPDDRMYMYYALGYALEQTGDYPASFRAYQQGARLFRGQFLARGDAYREPAFLERVRALKRTCTASTFARCAASGTASPSVTPIFIVGLPRAGSTLVEQILATHSKVEATGELAVIADIVRDLAFSRRMIRRDSYPDCVPEMTPQQLAATGERYLREAVRYRRTDLPYFIDKRPWNWLDAGLIHLILPHAKIIDIRREPMAACFAMYKQVLLDGADFSYDLHDLGRYYREYVGLMDHWASAMPDVIHFVQYERLVEDTEGEIRRMLEYCALPFEEGCLRFWETDRAVQTASSQQVRRPIYRDAVEQWRNFEPWLGPLEDALSEPTRT